MNESKEFGKKLIDNAFNGKSGHRIAIIGQEVFGDLVNGAFSSESYSIQRYSSEDFLKQERLINFTLCIIGYDAFESQSSQSHFFKQILEALENGVNFCFVFHNEPPTHSRGRQGQIGIGRQLLEHFKIPTPDGVTKRHDGIIKKQELRSVLKRWGSTKFSFGRLNDKVVPIYLSEYNEVLGFSFQAINGIVAFLPFAGNHLNNADLKSGLETLIDNFLTYLAKIRIDLPNWAKETSFFSDEDILLSEKTTLQEKLIKLEIDLQKFDEAKSILFHNEHNLEISLPKFLETHLGLRVEQKETFKEDFWLIGENDERIAISEIKSKSKGFRKNLVFFVLAHKESYELPDDFPTILFVNCNLQAGNWMEKDQPLNSEDCKAVKNQNVLVIRVEDIVRLWEMKRLGKITSKEILELFLTKKGWLQVTTKLKIEVLPK